MADLAQQVEQYYAQLLPGSFGGIEFSVQSSAFGGGFTVVAEEQYGRGTRPRLKQPSQETVKIRGYITGEDVLQRVEKLKAAFRAGDNILADPWTGVYSAVAVSWDIQSDAEQLLFVGLDVEFHATSIRAAEIDTTPADTDAALEEIAILGNAIGLDTRAAAQLTELADGFELDAESDDFFADAHRALLAGQAPPGSLNDVPLAISSMGSGMRSPSITSAEVDAIADAVLTVADRFDSPTLLEERALFLAYFSASGAGVLAQLHDGQGENLQALALHAGLDLDTAAQRNRESVLRWFATGEVRL